MITWKHNDNFITSIKEADFKFNIQQDHA